MYVHLSKTLSVGIIIVTLLFSGCAFYPVPLNTMRKDLGLTGYTPLMAASRHGDDRQVAEEIGKGSDVNDRNYDYLLLMTPLHYAALGGKISPDEYRYMDRIIPFTGEDRETAIKYFDEGHGTQEAYAKISERLLAAGADANAKSDCRSTPLHCAAFGNTPAIAARLIEVGADIEAKTVDSLTPLHYAAHGNSPGTAEVLIKKGADLNAEVDGLNALSMAMDKDNLDVSRVLIGAGIQIKKLDANPYACLLTAKSFKAAALYHGSNGNKDKARECYQAAIEYFDIASGKYDTVALYNTGKMVGMLAVGVVTAGSTLGSSASGQFLGNTITSARSDYYSISECNEKSAYCKKESQECRKALE